MHKDEDILPLVSPTETCLSGGKVCGNTLEMAGPMLQCQSSCSMLASDGLLLILVIGITFVIK